MAIKKQLEFEGRKYLIRIDVLDAEDKWGDLELYCLDGGFKKIIGRSHGDFIRSPSDTIENLEKSVGRYNPKFHREFSRGGFYTMIGRAVGTLFHTGEVARKVKRERSNCQIGLGVALLSASLLLIPSTYAVSHSAKTSITRELEGHKNKLYELREEINRAKENEYFTYEGAIQLRDIMDKEEKSSVLEQKCKQDLKRVNKFKKFILAFSGVSFLYGLFHALYNLKEKNSKSRYN